MLHATSHGFAIARCLRTFASPLIRSNLPINRLTAPARQTIYSTSLGRGLHWTARHEASAAAVAQKNDSSMNHGEEQPFVTRFADLSTHKLVCETVVKNLTGPMGLETMTPVQVQTINETLKGGDVLVMLPLMNGLI